MFPSESLSGTATFSRVFTTPSATVMAPCYCGMIRHASTVLTSPHRAAKTRNAVSATQTLAFPHIRRPLLTRFHGAAATQTAVKPLSSHFRSASNHA
ncbi:hypothetical protein E2542_SST05468 [Spatholobus suberectus]|nr:hypothetical protein E2542_SST05468 [Spatholobus suberectus]